MDDLELKDIEPPRITRTGYWLLALLVNAMTIGMTVFLICRRDPSNLWIDGAFLNGAGLLFAWFCWKDRDVVLLREGVRKGRGSRAKFIAWKDARFAVDGVAVTVLSKGMRIRLNAANFGGDRFWVFFYRILKHIAEDGIRRASLVENITTPAHTLSKKDIAEYVNYPGVWPWPFGRWALFTFIAGAIFFVVFAKEHGAFRAAPSIPAFLYAFPRDILAARRDVPAFFTDNIRIVAMFVLAMIVDVGGYIYGRFSKWKDMTSEATLSDTHVISISKVGVVWRIGDETGFLSWNSVLKIRQSQGIIILFADQDEMHVVPKRIFSTVYDAQNFYDRAEAFKRLASK